MDLLETHFEESRRIIIHHMNDSLPATEQSGKGNLEILIERLSNIQQTKFLEIANERLNDFEEKIKNLGFTATNADELTGVYKQKLIDFLGSGLKQYLLRNNNS